MNPHLSVYKHQQVHHEVQQATPLKLVILLYDKAISLLRKGQLHLQRNELKAKGEALNRVIEIMSELQAVLNHQEGGEVAKNLDALYTFVIHSVTQANLYNKDAPIQSVLGVLEELRKGWKELESMAEHQLGQSSLVVGNAGKQSLPFVRMNP